MYKVLILIALISSANAQALTILFDEGSTTRYDICVNKIIKKMGLNGSGYELVIRTKKLPRKNKAYVAIGAKPKSIILVINQVVLIGSQEAYNVIGHEMVHVQQMIRGDIFDNSLPYNLRLHEKEAFKKEQLYGKQCYK